MENEIIQKNNLNEKIINLVKKKSKLIIITISVFIILLISLFFFDFYRDNQNKKVAEEYIKAGIYLTSNNKLKSKNIYKEIVFSKNKFYSVLALNNIIENDLEKNSDEILKLFKIIESINIDFEQKNLIKLKKALYLKKISKDIEANKLLGEIIENNSIWKDTAIEVSKQ